MSSSYALRNRVTLKRVCPIGRVCIWKIADPDRAQILKESNKIIEKYNVTKEKRRVLREFFKIFLIFQNARARVTSARIF